MNTNRRISLFIMCVLYVAAGLNHFWHVSGYLEIMPPWLPWHKELVAISGACEIIFGLLLLIPATRKAAACCIILLLIAVFPANIQMTINYWRASNPSLWLTILRLPLQVILIWWAYGFTRSANYRRLI